MLFPAEMKYSKDHEWMKEEDGVVVIGISDFAQDALGADAWLIKVENVSDTEELLDAVAYEAFCAQEG